MRIGRFDSITRLFARRFSRRDALTHSGTGLAAGALAATGLTTVAAAQDGTPEASATCAEGPTMLFLQAFQAGNIIPKEGDDGRYILTLEQGLGHTVYFSDRPDRIVGSAPTPEFLAELSFPDDNPPNATLVVEMEPGQTEVVVLELFDPVYDNTTHTATYEVAVLAEFERSNGFAETDADLAELLPEFGAAHLFIDDCASACPPGVVVCQRGGTTVGSLPHVSGICCGSVADDSCKVSTMWTLSFSSQQVVSNFQCNARFTECNGNCIAAPYCASE
jgi:hypothetical protein